MKLSIVACAAAVALLFGGAARAADFVFGFDGCPTAVVEDVPGTVKTFELFTTLETSNNTGKDGPQGWSLSVQVDGGDVGSVTIKGVKVSTRFDDDGDDPDENGTFDDDQDPGTPEVAATAIVDPFEQDLAQAGFKVAQKATGDYPASPVPGTKGVVSAIVLHQTQKQVLQPSGKIQTAKLVINATIPDTGEKKVTIKYLNLLKGQGQPVNNVVTFAGASQAPTLGTCEITLRAPVVAGPEFRFALVGAGLNTAPTGDNELVQNVDIPEGQTELVVDVPVDLILATSGLTGKDGPQGWSASIQNAACMTVGSVTIKGVKVNTRFDDDGDDPDENGTFDDDQDPGTPEVPATPIIENFEQDLAQAGFKVAQKATGDYAGSTIPGTAGVVSAIVLHQTQKQVLLPNASDRVLRVVYRLTVKPGETIECKASLLDALKGQGQPVNNVITFGGVSQKPTVSQALTIKLTGVQVTPGEKDNFIRGDANDDGKIDIADPVWIVQDVVPGLGGPDTKCRDAGDANDDELLDLGDAVYLINFQFRGGPAPPPPNTCGTDDDSSETSCPAGSTSCP